MSDKREDIPLWTETMQTTMPSETPRKQYWIELCRSFPALAEAASFPFVDRPPPGRMPQARFVELLGAAMDAGQADVLREVLIDLLKPAVKAVVIELLDEGGYLTPRSFEPSAGGDQLVESLFRLLAPAIAIMVEKLKGRKRT